MCYCYDDIFFNNEVRYTKYEVWNSISISGENILTSVFPNENPSFSTTYYLVNNFY